MPKLRLKLKDNQEFINTLNDIKDDELKNYIIDVHKYLLELKEYEKIKNARIYERRKAKQNN